MTLICRITNENVFNPWELTEEDEQMELKSMTDLSLYDLGAEDLSVWVSKNNEGYLMHVEDENGNDLMQEKQIHPYAMESIARFCSQFLYQYERITDRN